MNFFFSRQRIFYRFSFIVMISFLGACSSKSTDTYQFAAHVPAGLQDSLLVDMVTYMGVKPKYADYLTKHDSVYRSYYVQQAENWEVFQYFINEEGQHFYYMIRPARHPLGNRRAIGGKLKLDEQYRILQFEEVFATQVLPEEQLKSMANDLFPALINGTFEKYLSNRQWIEWPDDQCQYDREKNEWRYDIE